jgi:hypothetical protein
VEDRDLMLNGNEQLHGGTPVVLQVVACEEGMLRSSWL